MDTNDIKKMNVYLYIFNKFFSNIYTKFFGSNNNHISGAYYFVNKQILK